MNGSDRFKKSESFRKKVFICYSHKDKAWKDLLELHLLPLERMGKIECWSDTMIQPGDKWEPEITHALHTSTIVIFFISAYFYASEYIIKIEVPKLLKKSKKQKTKIIPLIIGHSRFKRDKDLSQFHPINDPEKPLKGLSECEQEKVLDSIVEEIEKFLENINNDEKNRQPHGNLSAG